MFYEGYAFSPDSSAKAHAKYQLYQKLCKQYSIYQSDSGYCPDKINFSDYDLVIVRTPKYKHSDHKILKNDTTLTPEEILLICARGNLCFGGRCLDPNHYEVVED